MDKSDNSLILDIPRTEEEATNVSGVGALAALCIGAMARYDGIATTDEFIALTYAADILSEQSDNPTLLRTIVLKGLLADISFNRKLKEIKTCLSDKSEAVSEAIFLAVLPLIFCQEPDNIDKLIKLWTDNLMLGQEKADEIIKKSGLKRMPGTGLFERFSKMWLRKETEFDRAKKLSYMFHDEQLKLFLTKFENSEKLENNLETEIQAAAHRIITKSESLLPSIETIHKQREQSEQFLRTTEKLIEQIQQRLHFISSRIAIQKKMFNEDVEALIISSLSIIENEIQNLFAGREDSWADSSIWKQFSQTTANRTIQSQFLPIKARYDKLIDLLNQELREFSNELKQTCSLVFDNITPTSFSGLVKSEHNVLEFLNFTDRVTSTTLTTAKVATGVAVVGSGAAIMTGVATVSGVVSGAVAVASNPVGWVIGGTIAIAGIYKYFTNTERRKREVLIEKRTILENGLRSLLSDHIRLHNEALDAIERAFYLAASKCYGPLSRDAILAVMQARLEEEAILRVLQNTRDLVMELVGSQH